ncbi:DgyrCDS13730 [Dimorphilus gyrociliatus]|uniref:DgyrCDS13730 n=1 Tax=Dimorphilus gyrociliatus TaxID=2664684 RepID=A0A7I8WBK8_9ANNE|nr:DgyrCDS13730 [Dimorphilus gyrociliatus]
MIKLIILFLIYYSPYLNASSQFKIYGDLCESDRNCTKESSVCLKLAQDEARQCKIGYCACANGYYMSEEECKKQSGYLLFSKYVLSYFVKIYLESYNENCDKDIACARNLVCVNNKCACRDLFERDPSNPSSCVLKENEKKALGESCLASVQCVKNGLKHAACFIFQCKCAVSYTTVGDKCIEQKYDDNCKDGTISEKCKGLGDTNMMCTANDICKCKDGYERKRNGCFKIGSIYDRDVGESCSIHDIGNINRVAMCKEDSVCQVCSHKPTSLPKCVRTKSHLGEVCNLQIGCADGSGSCNQYGSDYTNKCKYGVCTCGSFSNQVDDKCYSTKTFNQSCELDNPKNECRKEYHLFCNDSICICDKGYEQNMINMRKCYIKSSQAKRLGEKCKHADECVKGRLRNATCKDGRCVCKAQYTTHGFRCIKQEHGQSCKHGREGEKCRGTLDKNLLSVFNRTFSQSCTAKPKGRSKPVQICKSGLLCQKCNYSPLRPRCVRTDESISSYSENLKAAASDTLNIFQIGMIYYFIFI